MLGLNMMERIVSVMLAILVIETYVLHAIKLVHNVLALKLTNVLLVLTSLLYLIKDIVLKILHANLDFT